MNAAVPTDPRAAWWLRLALGELAAARLLGAAGTTPARHAATFAHQTAEKALKAMIASEGATPVRTHDLVYLATRVDPEVRRAMGAVDLVTLGAVLATSRYPATDDPAISRVQAERWVNDAGVILTAVARHLEVDLDALEAA